MSRRVVAAVLALLSLSVALPCLADPGDRRPGERRDADRRDDRSRDRLQQARRTIDDLQDQVDRNRQDTASLQRELADSQADAERLEQQLQSAQTATSALESELSEARAEIARLRARMDRLKVRPPEPPGRVKLDDAGLSAKYRDEFARYHDSAATKREEDIARQKAQLALDERRLDLVRRATVTRRTPNRSDVTRRGSGWMEFNNGWFWFASREGRDRYRANLARDVEAQRQALARAETGEAPWAPPLTSLTVGQAGRLPAGRLTVFQVIDATDVLCRLYSADGAQTVWLSGTWTLEMVEGHRLDELTVAVVGTRRYVTAMGENRTVLELREFHFEPPGPKR